MPQEESPSSPQENVDGELPQEEALEEDEDEQVQIDLELPAPAAGDVENLIDIDLFCGNCGYNLRNISRQGRCPECGRFVSLTLAEGGKRPQRWWMKLMAAGIALLLIASVLTTVASFYGSTIGAVVFGLGPAGPKAWLMALVGGQSPLRYSMAGLLLHAAGMAAISWPESTRARSERIGWAVLIGLAVVVCIIVFLQLAGLPKTLPWAVVEFRILPLLVLFEVICLVLEYLRLAAIATRLRCRRLATVMRILSLAQSMGLLLLLMAGLAMPSEAVQWLTIGLSSIGAVIGTVACVWLMGLLVRGSLDRPRSETASKG